MQNFLNRFADAKSHKFEFLVSFCRIFNILIFLLREGLELCSALLHALHSQLLGKQLRV